MRFSGRSVVTGATSVYRSKCQSGMGQMSSESCATKIKAYSLGQVRYSQDLSVEVSITQIPEMVVANRLLESPRKSCDCVGTG